jgi:hypothetical protein
MVPTLAAGLMTSGKTPLTDGPGPVGDAQPNSPKAAMRAAENINREPVIAIHHP